LEAKAYYTSVLDAAKKNLLTGDNYSYLVAKDGNWWNFVRAWHDDASCRCADDLIRMWGGKLAAVDIWAESHCLIIQSYMRLVADPSKIAPKVIKPNCKTSSSSFLQFYSGFMLLLLAMLFFD
jgi:hypothetical protein